MGILYFLVRAAILNFRQNPDIYTYLATVFDLHVIPPLTLLHMDIKNYLLYFIDNKMAWIIDT